MTTVAHSTGASPMVTAGDEEAAILAAARDDDAAAFTAVAERYRAQLQVHCYRMVGSLEDAEDLVQETFLRAWRARTRFEGRSLFRTWLYRIATNACLNALGRQPRRLLPTQVAPPSTSPGQPLPPASDQPWLQPCPDELLDRATDASTGPEAAVMARATIELAFLAVIQLLPPRQRAVLIVRGILGWSAAETAALLDTTVAAVNSSLQRARATLREHLPTRPGLWVHAALTDEETALVRRLADAYERGDAAAWTVLLHTDVRLSMPPLPTWYLGRGTVVAFLRDRFADTESPFYAGPPRMVPTRANRQPALAFYAREAGTTQYRPLSLSVFRVEEHLITDIVSFLYNRHLFELFGLPEAL